MADNDAKKTKKKLRFGNVWLEARDLIWARRKRLGIGLLLIMVSRLTGLVLPAAPKILIDEVIGNERYELLTWLALAVGGATLIQAAAAFVLSQLLSHAAQRSITDMRKQIEQQVIRLPTSFFDDNKSGALIQRIMNDAEGIRNLVGTGLVQLIGGLISTVLGLVVLFYLNWQLTLITLVVLVSFAGLMAWAFGRMRPLFRQRNEESALVGGRLAEAIGGVRIVKAYTAEKREDLVFAKGVHKLLRLVNQSITATSATTAGSSLLFGGIGVIMIIVGGRAIIAGTMTLGDFVSYISFTMAIAGPMVQISNIATQLSEAFAGLDRVRELMQETREDDDDRRSIQLSNVRGDVRFDDVWFSYKEDAHVLRGMSFDAPAGSTTALVGSSGSGKSTTISLIMTFIHPQQGRILIDGHDLGEVRLADYRRNLGIVLQDNFLFDGTIAENIAYGNPSAGREAIERAGRIAHCHGFVQSFEEGYDTVVGERGVKLSGGQRQRVAIARAILADPTLLILDEATSSLDSESEAEIQDGLQSLREGRTTFVIAHRLSTIQSADQILVLENGEIVERGNHDELLVLDGRYRELYDKQYKLERNRFINPGEDFTPEPAPRTDSGSKSGRRSDG